MDSSDLKVDAFVDFLETASIDELRQFHSTLVSRLGIEYLPPMLTCCPPGDGTCMPPDPTYKLILNGINTNCKIQVLKELRILTGCGLLDAKNMAENFGGAIMGGLSKQEAEMTSHRLTAAGGMMMVVRED